MADALTVVRSLHILFAVLWGGASLFWGTVARKLGEKDASVPRAFIARSAVGPFLGITSLLTMVFGLATYFVMGPSNYAGMQNIVLSIGMFAGIVGVVVGWGGHLPNMVAMAKLINDGGDESEIERRMVREHMLDNISFVAVVVALVTMSTFRMFSA